MAISTITTKGQVTIPKQIRNLLNIDKGDRIEFLVDNNGTVTLWPITSDITELKGLVSKPEKYVSLKDMKNAIRNQGG
jgi:AbrB family looped-hinge helix DNA binding protein